MNRALDLLSALIIITFALVIMAGVLLQGWAIVLTALEWQ